MKPISADVLRVLSGMSFDGALARIEGGTLDRKLYLSVNDVLEALGGVWSRKAKGHVFPEGDAEARIDEAILTGSYERASNHDFFPTPAPLADAVVQRAQIEYGMDVLEPSAGDGSLAMRCAEMAGHFNVVTCELRADLVDVLLRKAFDVYPGDFLLSRPAVRSALCDERPGAFDRVVMNPPFSKQQDVDHITHAWQFVKPGGLLVAIASAGVTFRQTKKTVALRQLIDDVGGSIESNPEGSFKPSGTNVNTVTITMRNGEASHG